MPVAGVEKTATYLTFMLGDEIFAVDVRNVREVLDNTAITKVPRTPDFMRGVINLRGSVVPVVDMRLKFGMTATEQTVNTCIIIIEVTRSDGQAVLGALVDSVKEVINLEQDQIEPAPNIGTNIRSEFIKGMGKQDDHFIIILDADRVLSEDELSMMQEAV